MVVSYASAADTSASTLAPQPGSGVSAFTDALPLIVMVALFYLLLIRPQQRKIKDHDVMTKALRRGDKIITAGGVIGTIHRIENDDTLIVEIAENVRVRIMRDTVSGVRAKTVANDNKADEKSK